MHACTSHQTYLGKLLADVQHGLLALGRLEQLLHARDIALNDGAADA